MLAEWIDVSSVKVRNQLHIRIVDLLEAGDRRTIEEHATSEALIEHLFAWHVEVLLNAQQIGETDGHVFDVVILNELGQISLS